MPDSRPIGLFDSGIGGLSVWKELIQCLPYESTVYVADAAHCPYGSRPLQEVRQFSAAIVRFLLDQNCKLIIVACNTASAAALELLRAEFDVPIVGMEPALKPAAESTQTGHVGILATAGTFQGTLFQNTARRHANNIQVHIEIGQGLVEQVESGHFDTVETEKLLHQYLDPMLSAGVDQIALGCTHYSLLFPLIQSIVKGQARIIDPARAVVRQTQRILNLKNLQTLNRDVPDHVFFTTGQTHLLQNLTTKFNQHQVKIIPLSPRNIHGEK